MMDTKQVKNIIEACLLVAGKAMSLRQLDDLFEGDEGRPDKDSIKACIEELQADYEGRGIELVQVASGYRLQSRTEVSDWVVRLFPEKAPRYSRALLETLVLVAYRQPITRGEIEEIRGVAVSSNIVKTLQERQWVKEVGFKDVPGKPALLGTTKSFLDYFNLKRLDDLPPLSEIKNLDEMDTALMEAAGIAPAQGAEAANDDDSEAEGNAAPGEHAESSASDSEEGSEKTVYAAGEAGDSLSNVSDVGSAEASEGEQDEPVTFAGLVSRLPMSDDTEGEIAVENDLSGEAVEENLQTVEEEALDSETATEEPRAEESLLSAVSEFADEHKKEIEARDELESQLKTRYTNSSSNDDVEPIDSEPEVAVATKDDELVAAEVDDGELTSEAIALGDAIDASSASPEVLSDTFAGDSPGAGDTLH